MLRKITIILALSFALILWATPMVFEVDLQAEQVASVRPAKNSASYTPVGTVTGEINRIAGAKDFCSLYGVPFYGINDWFAGQEWYANYQDPEEYGCTNVWPFEVITVGFNIVVEGAISIDVQGYVLDADLTDPQCPEPGAILCQTPVYTLDIPSAGHWTIGLPMVDTCCVYDVYFAGIYIFTDLLGSGADAVSEDDTNDICRSYMDYGSGWEDLVVQWGWPGEMLLWSEGYTEPQNDCPMEEWPNHKMHFPQLPDLEGWDVYAVFPKTLADDWQCSATGEVTDIHFWGSWKDLDGDPSTDDYYTPMPWFQLSIHENIPATPDTPWSRPGDQIWFWEGEIGGTPFEPPAMEHWFNPNTGEVFYNDHVPYWRYDFFFDQAYPPPEPFFQDLGSIYWLNVSALYIPTPYEWGWKSSRDHFMDDAVYTDTPPDGPWDPLFEPPRANWFNMFFDPAGGPIDYGSTNYYGQGWYLYEQYGWWNMWFYNNPFTWDNPKEIHMEFNIDPVGGEYEFALNWSTPEWDTMEMGRPPLPEDGNEDIYIGRQEFPLDPGPNIIDFTLPYNPEWVSIDFRGYLFYATGWIWHECVQTSMDLAFVITGEEVPPDTGKNHYKTWRVEPETLHTTVFVHDQFMDDSLRLDSLCFHSNPVKKIVENDTFGIIKRDYHLTWYKASGNHKLFRVEYENQFESDTVVIGPVEYLLVPAKKYPHSPPDSLDHYKAYRINPKGVYLGLILEDQFDIQYGQPEYIDSLNRMYFLTPAVKNNEHPEPFDSITHYVAYEIFPKRGYFNSVNDSDQFGWHDLWVDSSKFLLVPTRKLSVEEVPTESLYWKPGYDDYAPNGMPDIDQKQDNWFKQETGEWSFCGPVAVANCFKWFDSKYNVPAGAPCDGSDQFPLVRDYTDALAGIWCFPPWDDHSPENVDHPATPWLFGATPPPPATAQPFVPGPQPQPSTMPPWGELVERLAWYFNTDGVRYGYCTHSGTDVNEMQDGIQEWLESEEFQDGSTLADTFCEQTWQQPTFALVESLVEKCEDVILLLGFWYQDPSGAWWRCGGHYVTVAGINSEQFLIGISDPYYDNAEAGGRGRVRNGTIIPHVGHPAGSSTHNDEGNVSHDIYDVTTQAISPGGLWELMEYPVSLNPYDCERFHLQNVPEEFLPVSQYWDGISPVFTEVEYAVQISPWDYRGDCNGDGIVNIADVVCLVSYLFLGGPPPIPLSEGDATCDGTVNIADAVRVVNYLFLGAPAPRCCDP